MSKPRQAPSKRAAAPAKGGRKAALKDLPLGADRRGAVVKGGRKTTVKDSHDKYA